MRSTISLFVLAAAMAGCGSKASDPQAAPAASPAPAAPTTVAAPVSAPGENLSGTVLEAIPAPPYVYLRLQTSKGEIWAAVSDAPVEVGAQVTVYRSMKMEAFVSKTLGRTFNEIYFGSLTAPGAAVDAGNPHAAVAQPTATAVDKVDKASGADARSVEETWAEGAALAGKSVTVRGKVVKYNPGVMGKNWFHLQDGSGDAGKGTNDLTVTSMDEVAMGDIVTISGTVYVDKDFGAGYRYPIIVEDAKVVK
jgi:hypothetical protein